MRLTLFILRRVSVFGTLRKHKLSPLLVLRVDKERWLTNNRDEPFLARVTRFGDSGASIIKYDCKIFPPRVFCEWN